MINHVLQRYEIILASSSPRRMELMQKMGIPFKLQPVDIDESYPSHFKAADIAKYLAQKKGNSIRSQLNQNQIAITADTIVWHNQQALNKPANYNEARKMLQLLSGRTHTVFTAIALTSPGKQVVDVDACEVTFMPLTEQEIDYYINNHQPFDKAGSYGAQDWLGLCKIKSINGSFYTVMGLPTHLLYQHLLNWHES